MFSLAPAGTERGFSKKGLVGLVRFSKEGLVGLVRPDGTEKGLSEEGLVGLVRFSFACLTLAHKCQKRPSIEGKRLTDTVKRDLV